MKKGMPPFSLLIWIILVFGLVGCQSGNAPQTAEIQPAQTTQPVIPSPTSQLETETPVASSPPADIPTAVADLSLPELEAQPWELVSYLDASGTTLTVLADSRITLELDNGQVGGTSGCNQYFGGYQVEGDQISIEGIGSTLMACTSPEGVMVQEQAYLNRLPETDRFQFDSDLLLFLNISGETILTFRIEEQLALTGTTWQLESYLKGQDAYASPLPGAPVTAEFKVEGTVSGSAGCNQYNAVIKLDGQQLTILTPTSTKRLCTEPPGVMEQETEYLGLLEAVVAHRIDGQRLNLLDSSQRAILVFWIRSDAAPTEVAQSTNSDGPLQASLSVDSLNNLEYSTGFTQAGRAPLMDGEYREPVAPGSAGETVVQLLGKLPLSYGELADGQLAAAVILVSNSGGSGTFYELALVVDLNGKPINKATTFLGDRVKINSVDFEDGDLLVDFVKQGPDDPMCCPTQNVLERFRLEGTQLVLVSSQEIK